MEGGMHGGDGSTTLELLDEDEDDDKKEEEEEEEELEDDSRVSSKSQRTDVSTISASTIFFSGFEDCIDGGVTCHVLS